jgi:hypothetical protein
MSIFANLPSIITAPAAPVPATSAFAERLKQISVASAAPVPVARADIAAIAPHLRSEVGERAEIKRIIALPISWPLTEEEVEEVNRNFLLADAFESGFRLNDKQAKAVLEFINTGGLFAPIGVGWGKTLITLMCADLAYRSGTDKIVLFVPPAVVNQLVTRDIPWARARVPISYPIHLLGGKSSQARGALARSGKRGLYVFPYSLLSCKDAEALLRAIDPKLMICDEAHQVGRRSSARTRRLIRFVDQHQPGLLALSGTITSKGVMDYHHLIRAALKEGNPLPNSVPLTGEWAALIDSDAAGFEDGALTGPLKPMVDWASSCFPDQKFRSDRTGFRLAFKTRLMSAPGVVSSGDADIGTSLIYCNRPVENHEQTENWNEIKRLIAQIEDLWLTPNGDEIDCAIHTFKWLYELTAGFYNLLTWPEPSVLAARRSIPEDSALDLIERAKVHHAAGQEYARVLRKYLEDAPTGLDTPFLVGQDMHRHGASNVPHKLFEAWSQWKALDFDGRPERDSKPVRVCPYKVDAAVQYAIGAHKHGGVILWHHHQEIGRWMIDRLREAGAEDVLHCPAGPEANAAITDPANVNKIIVASISAHGEGKNLQHFSQQYIVQWPRPAKTAEQVVGRTHRQGQKADELFVQTNNTTEFDKMVFAACLNDALYIQQTTGVRQKMIYAAYDPLPAIFPPEVLRERGLKAKILTQEQRLALEQRFNHVR